MNVKGEKNELTKGDNQIAKSEIYIGPYPDPSTLAQYENVKEGFADRLIAMAEKEQDARIKQNDKLIDIEVKRANNVRWNLITGLIGVFTIVGLCAYAFWLGHPTQAATMASVIIIGLAAVFVTGKYRSKEDKNSNEGQDSTQIPD
ncbi:MAG: DUF2335 domain-containing protein [Spirosomaceae bacterium]|jgi:uncharacterized membrane protein|nr:DUF2335 domain-containing protein [Spirosomataceae bacterium]